MGKKKNIGNEDPLISMLNTASKRDLIELLKEITEDNLSVRRSCIDSLKGKVTLSPSVHDSAESSAALTLWYEIEPGQFVGHIGTVGYGKLTPEVL